MTPQDLENFKEWGVPLPSRDAHGTEEDIRANLKPLTPRNWRMEGNRLVADTEMGELSQVIPTNYICRGTDDKGLPILTRIEV